jgi:hypothetical protein
MTGSSQYWISRRALIVGAAAMPLMGRPAWASNEKLFYAGCFHDTGSGSQSQIRRYLIEPERRRRAIPPATPPGADMSAAVRELLIARQGELAAVGLNLKEKVGQALVFGVARAQHEVATVRAPGVPDEYLIVVSITVSLDVLTDQAAWSNAKRFEVIYATMQVVDQTIQQRTPPSDAELEQAYLRVFLSAADGAVDQFREDAGIDRAKAAAVFQVRKLGLADPIQDILAPLLDGAIKADGETSGAEAMKAERERLSREVMHITTTFLRRAVSASGHTELAIMPAPSSWTRSRVLRVLQQRLGYGTDIPSEPDPTKMNGYTINAGILSAKPTVMQEESFGRVIQLNAQLGSQILRVRPRAEPVQVPSSITDPKARFAQGFGFRTYNDVVGITKSATRDVMMGSIRDAAKDMAEPLIALMTQVAKEIN